MIDRWLPPNHHLKRKVAFYASLIFGAVFLIVTPWSVGTNEDAEQQRAWKRRSWVPSWCIVRHVGIADRGSCDGPPFEDLGPDTYGECPLELASHGHGTRKDDHTGMTPSVHVESDCDRRGNAQYRSGHSHISTFADQDSGDTINAGGSDLGQHDSYAIEADGDASGQDDDLDNVADAFDSFDDMDSARRLFVLVGRRRGADRRRKPDCYRRYLAWAEVAVTESPATAGGVTADMPHRCAYTYGASEPSESQDDEDVANTFQHLQDRMSGHGMQCWVLSADDCVVAFVKEGISKKAEEREAAEEDDRSDINHIRVYASAFFGVASLVAAALAYFWYVLDYGFCDIIPPSGYQSVISTADSGEATQPVIRTVMDTVHSFCESALTRLRTRAALPPRDEVPLTARIRRIVDVAASGALGMMTPSSGGESLRLSARDGSRRTVQIAGPEGFSIVPRNIASDFIVDSDD